MEWRSAAGTRACENDVAGIRSAQRHQFERPCLLRIAPTEPANVLAVVTIWVVISIRKRDRGRNVKIELRLDTGGAAVAGVDRAALIDNLQAELDKFALAAGAPEPAPQTQPPPPGAQGDGSIVQWIMELAADPVMAKTYVRGLVLAVNSLMSALEKHQNPDEGTPRPGLEKAKPVTISVLGKEIGLPVATAVVKKFLEDFGE